MQIEPGGEWRFHFCLLQSALMSLNGNCDSINYVQSLLMGLVFVTFSLEGDSLCSVAAVIFAPRRELKGLE